MTEPGFRLPEPEMRLPVPAPWLGSGLRSQLLELGPWRLELAELQPVVETAPASELGSQLLDLLPAPETPPPSLGPSAAEELEEPEEPTAVELRRENIHSIISFHTFRNTNR